MSVTFIGTTFPKSYQWHQYEIDLIQNIQNQIELRYANFENHFINTTWFGPQFCNGEYQKLQQLIAQNKTFDNVFLLSAPDAIALNQNQILKLVIDVRAENYFLLGNFDSAYNFNFICTVLPIYFKKYKKYLTIL